MGLMSRVLGSSLHKTRPRGLPGISLCGEFVDVEQVVRLTIRPAIVGLLFLKLYSLAVSAPLFGFGVNTTFLTADNRSMGTMLQRVNVEVVLRREGLQMIYRGVVFALWISGRRKW